MDPLDSLETEELLQVFHRHKTEMSCYESPTVFINQLRDHNLIPEDSYKKLTRMKSKDRIKQALYDLLSWLEKNQSQHIKVFWSCVFKETIMNQYPHLRLLRNSLLDESVRDYKQLPEKMEKEESAEGKRKEMSEDEEEEETKANSVKKKKKRRKIVLDEGEEPSVSSCKLTPIQRKKSKKVVFSSPLKRGEKGEIWTWPIYKFQIPVTCGKKEGMLNRDRLAKGEKCIAVGREWFTPPQFESFAGKENCRNWKTSIRCENVCLGKLIKEGHLNSAGFIVRRKTAKRLLSPSDLITACEDEDEDEEEDEEEEQGSSSRKANVSDEEEQEVEQAEQHPDVSKKVFNVTCGTKAATLHVKRFASGDCGKSIRTETSWMTPLEFVTWASHQTDPSWRRDIMWEGNPLCVLTEERILQTHSLNCSCELCMPGLKDLENQKNDDECFICKREEGEELVVCDICPLSFHQKCHLPPVNIILGDKSRWMCTFCEFRTAQKWMFREEMEREAAMSEQISQHMKRCQYLLLYLCSADKEQHFATNPSLYLKDYSTIIQMPMWTGKVTDKLQNNLYQTVGEFVSDVQLIFTNSAFYNLENDGFLTMSNKLKELFDSELKKVFNIREESND
nr:nuclear body protein SP140-like protein isoform X2 [Labrus bergylta]